MRTHREQSLLVYIGGSFLIMAGVCGLIAVLILPAALYLATMKEYWFGLYFIIVPVIVGIWMKLTESARK